MILRGGITNVHFNALSSEPAATIAGRKCVPKQTHHIQFVHKNRLFLLEER